MIFLETEVFGVAGDNIRIRSPLVDSYKRRTIREQILRETPKLANDPEKLNKEIMKRIENYTVIDSSYYLG